MKKLLKNLKKILTITFVFVLSTSFFIPANVFAQNGNYTFTIANDVQVSDRVLEFDLNLLNTNPGTTFNLAAIQAGIFINPAIINGGIMTVSIVPGSSELDQSQAPTAVAFDSASNIIKMAPQVGQSLISSTGLGTRVVRLRLTDSVPFGQATPNLNFNLDQTHPVQFYRTVVVQNVSGTYVPLIPDVTNCYSTATNNILNSPVITCQTGADTNSDGVISNLEILNYINSWKIGNVTSLLLLKAIGFWKIGTGC